MKLLLVEQLYGSRGLVFNSFKVELRVYGISSYSSDTAEITDITGVNHAGSGNPYKDVNVLVEWGAAQIESSSSLSTMLTGNYVYWSDQQILALLESLGAGGIQNPYYVYSYIPAYTQTTTTTKLSTTLLSVAPADGTGENLYLIDAKKLFEQGNLPDNISVSANNYEVDFRTITAGESNNAISVDGYGIIHGGGGNDSIEAYNGVKMLLDGGPGDDLILGSWIYGDMIIGGPGNDTLYGNGNNDRYYFMSGDTGTDVLLDADYSNYGSGSRERDEFGVVVIF